MVNTLSDTDIFHQKRNQHHFSNRSIIKKESVGMIAKGNKRFEISFFDKNFHFLIFTTHP